ncbi:uncharacterized protein LOC121631572 [Melanotaenia boesemani]|uniref:uncharacterized protein LOC121631572 n=1 Tax=Melanotaenia boesemani TaxID=1250792 RepID=UPI001C0517CD|nr:uncharacterized protein LOC121631572 [Melanotaenia boesemani]
MAPNNSSPSLATALEALGEMRLANFSQAQLQSEDFVSNWFQKKIRPFLASSSTNFLICLSNDNFSCLTYQIVIKAFSNQKVLMDSNTQRAVFTHFSKQFLSRNDSSDPGCVSSVNGSQTWLQANLGSFSVFATLQELQVLNPNVSRTEFLSELDPAQVAQVLLSIGTINDTALIDRVFERLEVGNALENVDQFLTQLTANEQVPQFTPIVRDHVMNKTFIIISPHFQGFNKDDFEAWFHVKLVFILASFTPEMLNNATSGINCTNYQVVVSGMAKVFSAIPMARLQEITDVLLGYLRTSASVINTAVCRQDILNDGVWVQINLGPFSQYTTYSDLKVFNLTGEAVVSVLSPQQKAEFILDPDSGALEDPALVRVVLTNLTQSGDEVQLRHFFEAFTDNKQQNITIIKNPAVRDTILNLTLAGLAPQFEVFQPEDFQLWFQFYLLPVIASLQPYSLWVIPSNISCASYEAILIGLEGSLEFLPLDLSMGVRSSMDSLINTFPRCSVPDSFKCKETTVDEDLICADINRSQLQQKLVDDNSTIALCNLTIIEHACSLATHLTQENLASLLKCSLESQRTYPVEVWKLFFHKASAALDQALDTFATMAPNNSSPSLATALEALGEMRLANFSQAQLQSEDFVSNWFQKKIRPFLASSSTNFLICLSNDNFSCLTYQIVIKAFSNQKVLMDSNTQRAVFTHFSKQFLSRNDSSDPGCVSSVNGSQTWLQANLGSFSVFATLQELQVLNPNFSSTEFLSELDPAQVAQVLLSIGTINDTALIDRVFERLEVGNALENVDQFLTQLTANEQVPQFTPIVRDHVMNKTFIIISPHFQGFNKDDFEAWFHVKLVFILASFTPEMLNNATSGINCTNYQVVVSGMAKVFSAIPMARLQEITDVLLGYLRKSASVINTAVCRQDILNDGVWVQINLGPFSQYTTYSDLKVFNLTGEAVVSVLSPQQKAEFILDPDSGALEDPALVRVVLTNLTQSGDEVQLRHFFEAFTDNKQQNITIIKNPAVRDTILNLTLAGLAPQFEVFQPEDFQLWFQFYLLPVIASLQPYSLWVIPSNISCASYEAILIGLEGSLKFLPLDLSMGVRSSMDSLINTFPRCSVPDSFKCKETTVDEDLICADINRSQLQQKLVDNNSTIALCNLTIIEHACSLATHLTQENLASLLKCSLESQRTYPVEVWKLFFHKASAALDQALDTFATMAPNNSSPSLATALEALGEMRLANFSQAQLQSEDFISNWFQKKIRPFLASSSTNFLICLSNDNFSCLTYQIVIKAFSNQKVLMDSNTQRAVFTHFSKQFLSRNDSSDPGCVSSVNGSQTWLQANLGSFSVFATLQELQVLNPNFSSTEFLSELDPAQVAQVLLSIGTSNDTDLIDSVFERLEVGNALENVDQFLTQLTANEQVPQFTPIVRDHVMNKTFIIISPHFQGFNKDDFEAWFHVKLVFILASFTPEMLNNATSGTNCTNYQVVVSGMAKVFSAIPMARLQEITDVLLGYLRKSASVINTAVCRQEMLNDVDWVEINLGPFSQYTTYSDLKVFNLSQGTILDSISSGQKAEFLLEGNNLSNQTLVILVFTRVVESASLENLDSFFAILVNGTAEQNLMTVVRDTILNLTLTALSPNLPMLNSEGFKLWFQVYLPLFLPSFDNRIFEIIPRNITCESYQEIVKGFDNIFTQLSERQTEQVYRFTLDYLRGRPSSGLSCVAPDTDDRQWLERNFGPYFVQASFMDLVSLKKNFRGVEVADLLSINQLSQLAAIPTQLNGALDVSKIMAVINPADFAAFFNTVSAAIEVQSANYTQEVKSAFLQAVFDRGGLSSSAVSDNDFLLWLKMRLRPLLVDLSPKLVTPLFSMGTNRSCSSSQEMITLLDTLQKSLSNNTQKEIYENIVLFLQGPVPLKCYSGGSFYIYLRSIFLSFGFPDLPTLISLLPSTQKSELISTFNTSELQQFLSQSSVINNNSGICDIFNNFNNTATFLETEDVPDDLKVVILPCVWPLALSSYSRSEVNLWFNLRLKNYLRFLTKNLISYTEVQNTTCVAFQELVSFMGNSFTYNISEFGRADVYTSINSYLRVGSGARCYNSSDPELNSTSWFANYIGSFVTFITLDELTAYVSTTQIFLEDQTNLELFNNTAIPQNVTSYYISQLFTLNPSFSPIKLPGSLLCSSDIPSLAYSSLNEADALVILNKRKSFCNGTEDPEISAALASTIQTITTQTFVNLGDACSGLTISQITSVSPSVLTSSLSTLSSVTTWSQGQANIIIQTIISSGFQINRASVLQSLGTLVVGLPAQSIENIAASELLSISTNTSFVSNMLAAPTVVQQTFVQKIISVDPNPTTVVLNVPDAMATQIPPSLLVFSGATANINVMNKKTWTPDQATMFFGNLGETTFDIEQLSPSVLQGFTCTSADKMTKGRINQLIHACRPRGGRAKVQLTEARLTCMYNLLRGALSQNFTDYPSDMLLYFKSTDVQKSNCRSYFSALGAADFSVASTILNKSPQLFSDARTCLGINGKNLSRDNIEVLGNMICTLDGSYIKDSDPFILETLKACKDFSDSQVAAMESLLLSEKTKYGNKTTWNQQTLEDLGNLPLYFTRNIWGYFKTPAKRAFFKNFMPHLRTINTQKRKLKKLFQQISSLVAKRGAGCTVGNITQVTVSDGAFPFGYDQTQFDLCLDVPVLKDNLNSICEKVDDNNYQQIILQKLNQAYPSGVPDEVVQMLGSVSRVASLDDISKWKITKIDTLAALMITSDGPWETANIKEIIEKYLNTSGKSLRSTELNIINSYVCSLNTSTLKTINSDSIRNANLLNVTACSVEQKSVLYEISTSSFRSFRSISSEFYNLIKTYLGGAPLADIVALSSQNISMDVDTFRSLKPDVITALTVTNVKGLMGSHLRDLKLFENDTVVQTWVNLQLQSDLDTLGVGLISTRTSESSSNSTAAPVTSNATISSPTKENISNSAETPTSATTTQAATTSGGVELVNLSALIFLAVLLTAVL